MFPLSLPPKLVRKKDKNIAIFEMEALYPGYGITVGSALRRVLLSSLEGAAITQVKIKGVQHEFSTVPGVIEDVMTIILNLKKLRFKFFADEPQKATLFVKGEKEVKGSDFKLSPQVKIVNSNNHIATLTLPKSQLDIEIQIEKGIGYESAEVRNRKLFLGEIAIDAAFSPVQRVSFQVENMRVKDRTDFDRLILEVETDGIISPEEALVKASEVLISHFSLIKETFKEEKRPTVRTQKVNKTLQQPVEELKLSNRTLNALLKNKIFTVEEILGKGKDGLKEIKGLGEKGKKEIEKKLKKMKLEF